VRGTFLWLLLLVPGVMAVLGWLRFRFALRFWARMRRLGYLYVGLIVVLAALSLLFHINL